MKIQQSGTVKADLIVRIAGELCEINNRLMEIAGEAKHSGDCGLTNCVIQLATHCGSVFAKWNIAAIVVKSKLPREREVDQ